MYGPWESVADRETERNRRTDRETGKKQHRVTKITGTEATKMDSYFPDQPQAKERTRKHKKETMMENIDSIPLSDSQYIIDQSQECVEMSSWMMGYPDGENASEGGADVDPQSEEGITNDDPKPRRLCATRKRLRSARTQRERPDTDSVEKVNSELLDPDNSGERIPAQTL